MFFFKRKEDKTPYEFKGIRHSHDFDLSKEDIISCLDVCKKFLPAKKVFTKADIGTISDKLGFKFDEVYYFKKLEQEGKRDPSKTYTIKLPKMNMRYLFNGVKDIPENEGFPELITPKMDETKLYSLVEIQTLAAEIGCDVFDRSNWVNVILFEEDNGIKYFAPCR